MKPYKPLYEESNIIDNFRKKHIYTIYLDCDGVLTDFQQHFYDHFGVWLEYGNRTLSNDEIFEKINSVPNWWLSMPWKKGGKQLLNKCKKLCNNVILLTTPADSVKDCKQNKLDWAKKEIGNIKVIFFHKKEKYANPHSILIDDKKENVDKFSEAGGIGIFYDSFKKVIDELNKIF